MDETLNGRAAIVLGSSAGLGLGRRQGTVVGPGVNVVLAARRGDLVEAEADRLGNALGLALH